MTELSINRSDGSCCARNAGRSRAAGVLKLSLLVMTMGSASAWADLSAGFWANYRYVADAASAADDRDSETLGDLQGEALILYLDDKAEDTRWSISGEVRYGPGSFTDPDNNSTSNNFTIHKAWIGYEISSTQQLQIGKSQVPFGWKTANFWPGDMLQAGYGDQMDVGVKYSSKGSGIQYDVAYYHADDWGETSTDTVDDNGHWGSSTTYRKVQTLVGNVRFPVTENHQLGVSVQAGNLQDLTGTQADDPVDGSHSAAVLYYLGQFNKVNLKAEIMQVARSLPANYAQSQGFDEDIDSTRAAVELGFRSGPWYWYLDATMATPGDQPDDSVDTVMAFAPGVSYDYGPGWFYFEVLTQDGWVGRDGNVGEGDFSALYISADYYF